MTHIDLSEPKRLLLEARDAIRREDPADALALATMGMLAYTIAAAEMAMRVADEVQEQAQKDRLSRLSAL